MNDYFDNMIQDFTQAAKKYDEIPLTDWEKYEPQRSRVQIDITKATRIEIHNKAKKLGVNPKVMWLNAMSQAYPELRNTLQREIKRTGYTIKPDQTNQTD